MLGTLLNCLNPDTMKPMRSLLVEGAEFGLPDDTDFCVRITTRGQQDMRTRFTLAATAAAIRGRLEELRLL